MQKTTGPNSYIGLTESQAIERAYSRDIEVRIIRRDSESLPITDDYRSNRINFEIDNGKVTKAERY